MAEDARKCCLLAVDGPHGPLLRPLLLPAGATIAAALSQAQADLQAAGIEVAIDWAGAATGVWGTRCERHFVPLDGDRIEVYRALSADPRHKRRLRAGRNL